MEQHDRDTGAFVKKFQLAVVDLQTHRLAIRALYRSTRQRIKSAVVAKSCETCYNMSNSLTMVEPRSS